MRHTVLQLKKFALAILVSVIAMLGVPKARAGLIQWGPDTSNEVIFYDWSADGGQTVYFSASNVNIVDTRTSHMIPNDLKWSLIYVANVPGGQAVVGQVKGVGTSATGCFSIPDSVEEFNINTIFVENGGRYVSGIDLSLDGVYGTIDDRDAFFSPQVGEYLCDLRVAYDLGGGTFSIDAKYISVSANSTLILSGLGASAVGFGKTNILVFSFASTDVPTFRIEYRDSLTNATWSSLGQYSVTGAVTVVTDTNTVPQRFYHAVSP